MPEYVEPQQRPEPQPVTWTLSTTNWNLNRSSDPEATPSADFCLVVGMDGSDAERMHRSQGFRLWMDPLRATGYRGYLREAVPVVGADRYAGPENKALIDVVPFCINKADTAGYCFGAVYTFLRAELSGANNTVFLESAIVWKTSATHDLRDPAPDAYATVLLDNYADWAQVGVSSGYRCWQKPLYGFGYGRYLYLFSSKRFEDVYYSNFQRSEVLWYTDTVPATQLANTYKQVDDGAAPTPNVKGVWYSDWYGVPEEHAVFGWVDLVTHNSGGRADGDPSPPTPARPASTYVRGACQTGQYAAGARLVDSKRMRYSNAGFMSILERTSGNKSTVSAASAKASIATTSGADRSCLFVQARLSKSKYGTPSYGFPDLASYTKGLYVWDYWQPLVTISSLDATERPSQLFFVADEMPTHPHFQDYTLWQWATEDYMNGDGGLSSSEVEVGSALVYVWRVDIAGAPDAADEVSRREDYVGDGTTPYVGFVYEGTDGTNRRIPCTYVPMVDEVLAIQPQYDPVFDTYYDWRELGDIIAACPYGGGVVLAIIPRERRDADASTADDKADQAVWLVWSDPRRPCMENIPISCAYATSYNVHMPGQAASYLSATFVRGTQEVLPIAIVQAGNSTYAFGDGPVYQLTWDASMPAGMSVQEIDQGKKLVSKYSVASFGTGILMVTDRGVFVMDTATNTSMEVKQLSTLMKQRWVDPVLRASISVAFDSVTATLNILCGRTGELIRLWLSSNRITFDECTGFMHVRESQISDNGQSVQKRALFFTPHGKIYYPADDNLDNAGARTMHGLTTYTGSAVRPTQCHAYVAAVNEYVENTGTGTPRMIGLHLHKSATDATTVTVDSIYATDLPVQVLTGTLADKTYLTYWCSPADLSISGYELLLLVPAAVSAASLLNQTIALSPINSYVVGGPLPGQTARRLVERIQVNSALPGLVRPRGDYSQLMGTASSIRVGVCTADAVISTDTKTVDATARGQFQVALDRWLEPESAYAYLADSPSTGVTWSNDKPYLAYAAIAAPYGQSHHTLLPVCHMRGGSWDCYLQWLSIEGTIGASEVAR